ncbi:prostatic acid phosphatase-like isoform X1 [Acropora millepora]|uniref:prostatic acid phosphatase-like isoform X1 n=2 Tax=Acropora millepora TaxID=45264 RepID=UPI001CF17D13|nr:prostatic acid phosphatase-like isoform X1 [Acropora millepora]
MMMFIFLIPYFFTIIKAELQVRQAVVISRHGSRTLLRKDHKTFEERTDSQLTVRGMDQMFRAGSYVQKRYQNLHLLSSVYSPSDIYVRSSDYSRTLNSALSFLLGLYPPKNKTIETYAGVFSAPHDIQQVPIHTVAVQNDQLLRGWLVCPRLNKRLTAFYESMEFKMKKTESALLRKTLEKILNIEKIELTDFYNVYDYIHLHRLYNHTYLNITDKQWRQVVNVADWVEYNKYSQEVIGDIGGGLLANEIAFSFSEAAANRSKAKLLYYSAHYGTMFSLFTALGLNEATNSTLRRIPYYASLIFIELLQDSSDGNQFFVRFSLKNGLQETLEYHSIPGCKDPCALRQFINLAKSLKVTDIATWCQECGNNELSQCKLYNGGDRQPTCHTSKQPTMSGTGGFFLGMFVTFLLTIFSVAFWHYCLKKYFFPAWIDKRRTLGLNDLENAET